LPSSILGIPSKLYRILGNRKPLLAVTHENSDMADFVRTSKGGLVVGDFAIETLQKVILQAQSNRSILEQMANDGRDYVASNFSRPTISSQYATLLNTLVSQKK
jgi:glycosyltransferase involved in cell wall biosynthesis